MTTALLTGPARRLLEKFGMARPHPSECEPTTAGAFYFRYDDDTDLLFARCGEPQVCDNVQIDDNVVVRVSRASHQPVGIEVIAASERFRKDRSAINRSFARELLSQYGAEATRKLAHRR